MLQFFLNENEVYSEYSGNLYFETNIFVQKYIFIRWLVETIGHFLQSISSQSPSRIFQESLLRMLQLKIYFRQMYSIKLLITPYNLSSHAHVHFTNHYFERINPSQGIFMKRVKTYPYRKQKFDEQKVERGRNKRLSGCETSGSLSTGSDNSANLETWSNTRPCNVRPASVNVARAAPSPNPLKRMARVHAHARPSIFGPGRLNVGPWRALSARPDTLFMRDKVFHGIRARVHTHRIGSSATRRIKRRYFTSSSLKPFSPLHWWVEHASIRYLPALLWVKRRFGFVEDFFGRKGWV